MEAGKLSVDAGALGGGREIGDQLAKMHRIVERGDRATLLIDDKAWITMVKEGGQWKSGD